MTDYRSWYHVIMVFIITSLTIRAIQTTRNEAADSYYMQHQQLSRNVDHDWLKARTLHIKGIPAEDRTGNGLKTILENFLKDKGGRVVAMQLVPPFSKIFSIETKIKDMRYLQMLTSSAEEHFFLCVPSKYLQEDRYEEKLEKYEEKLIDETLKPFVPSGHAFVCFDSINSV